MTDKAELLRIADRLQDFALAEGCPTAAMRDAADILRKLAGKPERKAQAGFDAAGALAANALDAKDAEIATLKEEVRLAQVAKSIEAMFVEARGDTIKCLQSEIATLRAENESNKIAYEQSTKACHDLTEKVIPNLRADAERVIHVDAILADLIGCKPSDAEGQPVAKLNWYRSLVQAGIDAARSTT